MLTEKQNAVMNWIAFNEMTQINGARPENAGEAHCFLWLDEIAAYIGESIATAKGVIGSLAAANLIGVVTEPDPDDSGVYFTDEGYKVWDAQNPEEPTTTPETQFNHID